MWTFTLALCIPNVYHIKYATLIHIGRKVGVASVLISTKFAGENHGRGSDVRFVLRDQRAKRELRVSYHRCTYVDVCIRCKQVMRRHHQRLGRAH